MEETFTCVRCGGPVPVTAPACPACGLEVYPVEGIGEGECRCRACGGDMAIDDTVCPHCGTEVLIEKAPDDEYDYFCSQCGREVAEDDTVCPYCGADLEEDETLPESDEEEDGYVCSVCGGDVAVDDKVCPHCGADVEEIEETPPPSPPLPPPPERGGLRGGHTFSMREVHFLKEAERLPEDWAAAITPVEGEKLVIPARDPKVGDIVVRFSFFEIVVSVGKHTEGRFPGASDAVDFIRDVVTDRIIFHFVDGEVEVYRAEELDDSEVIDWSYYVWSGPLRNQRTGIDWYRP